ncbi:MAG: hypothetical protein IIT39_04505 [Clostridia bacterium]|nr:hypothetical protein [Clostridia bacterium]
MRKCIKNGNVFAFSLGLFISCVLPQRCLIVIIAVILAVTSVISSRRCCC